MTRKVVDNSTYKVTIDIGASLVKRLLWYITNAVIFRSRLIAYSALKVGLLKLFGANIAQGVVIKPAVNIKFPWKLSVGEFSWIGEEVWIDNLSNVSIGNDVTLSQGAMLLTGSHDFSRTSFDFISSPIVLEDGVWIGARAVVFGGVVVSTHAILGINSVAESDLDPYLIYKGNPAIPVLERKIVQ